nr:hypothetical protein [Tanacetum cinerariifolium]
MEVLTLMLRRKVRDSDGFRYHRYCSDLEIINLCFADDLFIFAHGDRYSTKILPFEEGRLLVKYLGVPLVSSRLVFRDCKELVDRIRSRINDWKNKSLSAAGRLQLVRSVLGSMHVYWALVFILPSYILLDIEKLMRGFLWCHREMKQGRAKVAWEVGSPVAKSWSLKTSLDHSGMGDVGNTSSEHTSMDDVVNTGVVHENSKDGIACNKGGRGFVFGKNEFSNGILKSHVGPFFNVNFSNNYSSNPFVKNYVLHKDVVWNSDGINAFGSSIPSN